MHLYLVQTYPFLFQQLRHIFSTLLRQVLVVVGVALGIGVTIDVDLHVRVRGQEAAVFTQQGFGFVIQLFLVKTEQEQGFGRSGVLNAVVDGVIRGCQLVLFRQRILAVDHHLRGNIRQGGHRSVILRFNHGLNHWVNRCHAVVLGFLGIDVVGIAVVGVSVVF